MSDRAKSALITELLADAAGMVRFYSRIPVPRLPFETTPHAMPAFSRAPRTLPLAALIIAMPGVLALAAATWANLPPTIAAALAISATILTTGALHEDGLADCADGFGGGGSVERKLEIMKDSRLGSYGAAALVLSLLLRTLALSTLLERFGLDAAACAVFAAAALSRTASLLPLALLPPARAIGAAHDAGRPTPKTLMIALGFALILTGILGGLGGIRLWPLVIAALCAFGAGLAVTLLSSRMIRGQTGDVAGAAQQAAEIVFLLSLLILR